MSRVFISYARDDVEAAKQLMGAEREADLLPGFPDGGSEQVLIRGVAASAGKSHVAGPGVPAPFGPPDYQNGIGIGTHNQGDGRLAHAWVADRDRRPTVKP